MLVWRVPRLCPSDVPILPANTKPQMVRLRVYWGHDLWCWQSSKKLRKFGGKNSTKGGKIALKKLSSNQFRISYACSSGVLSRFLFLFVLRVYGGWPCSTNFSCYNFSIVSGVFLFFRWSNFTLSHVWIELLDFSSQSIEFATTWNDDRSQNERLFLLSFRPDCY
jgi:hypothetical protein